MKTLGKTNSYSAWLSITIGLGDGLIVPFAVLAGLTPVLSSASNIGLIGLLVCFGGAIVMSFGGYFSILSAQGDSEYKDRMDQQTDAILQQLDMQEYIGREIAHPGEAAEEARFLVLQKEIQQQGIIFNNPLVSSLLIGIAYLAGGIMVIIPFLLQPKPETALWISAIVIFSVLLFLGLIKSRYSAKKPLELIIRLWIITAFAAGGTFLFSSIFIR